ncbi:hypothetical protein [Streptomyces sp. NPDC047315]|uniref:hypothetical protein n=1 Tax=Streptomyces sp. NPDC047315 TaxID=3155142 RepID=UPI003410D016
MDDVKGLLGRAVEGSAWSGVTTDGVFAEAAKRRWRRRITATAVAAVVAATGVVGVPRVVEGWDGGDHRDLASMVGTSMKLDTSKAGEEEAARLARLLPAGRFDEVRMVEPDPWRTKGTDGTSNGVRYGEDGVLSRFVVRWGDQVGLIGIDPRLKEGTKAQEFCVPAREDCEVQRLSNGDEIVTWRNRYTGVEGHGRSHSSVRSFARADGKFWVEVSAFALPNGSARLGEPPLSPDELGSLQRDERLLDPAPK